MEDVVVAAAADDEEDDDPEQWCMVDEKKAGTWTHKNFRYCYYSKWRFRWRLSSLWNSHMNGITAGIDCLSYFSDGNSLELCSKDKNHKQNFMININVSYIQKS